MKKLIKLAFAFAACTFMMSCSQDEAPEMTTGNGDMSNYEQFNITVQAPTGIRSRGYDANGLFGDGSEATHLQYQVWKVYTDASDKITDHTCVFDSRNSDAPQATYKGDGKFSLKLSLLKTQEDKNKTGFYLMRLWADAWGQDEQSPYTLYWDDFDVLDREYKGWIHTASNFSIDYNKSFGTFDKADVFCNKMHVLASLDLKTKNTTVSLTRPLAQVCIVSPEFNEYEPGYESKYRIFFSPYYDRDEDGGYLMPDNDNYDIVEKSGKQFWEQNIVPTDARITIDGKEMRYLYVGYLIPFMDKPKVVCEGKEYELPMQLHFQNGSTGYENTRIIIYPKNTENGGGFYSEAEDFDLNVIVQPGFSGTNNTPVDN